MSKEMNPESMVPWGMTSNLERPVPDSAAVSPWRSDSDWRRCFVICQGPPRFQDGYARSHSTISPTSYRILDAHPH